jgi:spermidine/putrescine transport system substrate-binding protein
MTQREPETDLERAIARAFARGRYTRRAFLGRSGRGLLVAGSALSLPSILAACGIGPQTSPTPGATNGGNGGDTLQWANWPFYIDQDEDTGESDTINQFEEETGISVNYREVIEDNESFFGTIQPSLAAGQPAGWDMITPTDYMCQRLIRLGYLQELDWSKLPNVEANIDDV